MKLSMSIRAVAAVLLPLVAVTFSHAADTTRPAPPTQQDIETLVGDSKFKEALDGIAQSLAGANANNVDRMALLKLRVECQLQLKQATVTDTLEAIRKLAVADKSAKDEAFAQSFVLLIKRSSANTYRPKTTSNKTPLNILDATTRNKAFDALFADELASCKKTISDATSSGTIKPIIDTAARVSDVLALERYTYGVTTQTAALAKTIATDANSVIQSEQDEFARVIELASQEAQKVILGRGRGAARAGLSPNGAEALQTIVTTSQQIVDMVPLLRKQLDQDKILENAKSRAMRQQVRARTVLDGRPDPGRDLGGNTKDQPSSHEPFSE